jgi:hypothetical protein
MGVCMPMNPGTLGAGLQVHLEAQTMDTAPCAAVKGCPRRATNK